MNLAIPQASALGRSLKMSFLPRSSTMAASLAMALVLTLHVPSFAGVSGGEGRVLAFTYPQGEIVSMNFHPTSRLPEAAGIARVERLNGMSKIAIDLTGMKSAAGFGGQFHSYTLWVVSPEGRVENLGELVLDGSRSRLEVETPLDTFGMFITAEPHFLTSRPSRFVVLENVGPAVDVRPLQVQTVQYEGFAGDYAFERESLAGVPQARIEVGSDIASARTAVQLAEAAGAVKFAADELAKAKDALRNAESRLSSGAAAADITRVAHEVVRLAVSAETAARERTFQDALARERNASSVRIDSLESSIAAAQSESERNRLKAEQRALDAELEARARDEAEREAADAARRAADAEKRAHAAEEDRIAAEKAKLDAEQGRIAAEREAADARLARENARADLREAMASIAAVRESARGLIVSLPNILFATNQAVLKPEGREALAKISGILQVARGYSLSVEGHTDSVGTAQQNLELSEKRAASVRDYLVEQGVPAGSVSAKGFGESTPIATNDTSAGRQENRRVEIVVVESPDFGIRRTSN
jgi:outer membrane protein OmpA-like peptidoglycan-associated protein